ncbi:MarR family winged helix-turn-helix transcriptional regulator [Microvirga terricola]|uniref:Winged helix-turn-helix transcriptional regulator n=1 Tax=Microvirga terricola TaxID=2719797 RepID=A0ABX0VGV5_9HYPH|nr:MarR family winged helix-turn-helix transcriptional regulator [Microvirga terricola]NIX78045.1 winged helix-turn-helix transcriptional regulator [Microvirga terricola]
MQRPSEAVVDLWIRLNCAQRRLRANIEADLKKAGLPSLDWYSVLLHLKRVECGRLSPREIEEGLLFEQYNLSRLLDRMEKEGLVRRIPYPGDKRRQLIEITDKGRGLQKRMWLIYGAAIDRFLGARLDEGQVEQLSTLLSRL